MPGLSAARQIAPDELVVKFRASASDPNAGVEEGTNPDLATPRELPTFVGRSWIHEVRPVLKGPARLRERLQSLRGLDPSQLTPRQRHLLQRQSRALALGRDRGLDRIYRIRVDLGSGESLEDVLAALRRRPDVEYAEPNPVISACVAPNDRLYADQWSLARIHAAEAWDTCRGSNEVVVAVIDTGVDYNHPDLQGNLWINEVESKGLFGADDDKNGYTDDARGYNFAYGSNDPIDDHGHGTACAGIIAAVGNNNRDIAGVCWTAKIMPLKILDSTGNGTVADAIPAIHYAVDNGADIISGSWGGEENSAALQEAIAYARDQGVVVVAAAGNAGLSTPYYPAAYPEVISVAATDETDQRWIGSNYGAWVSLAAPGVKIVSLSATVPGQVARDKDRSVMTGTSLAAPHVTGTCALLLAADPFLTCAEVQQIVTTTGDSIDPGTCSSNRRLNVANALRAAIPTVGTIRLDRVSYPENADIGLLLADWDLRGAGHYEVSVSTARGDQETAILRETNVASGVFRGSLATKNAAAKVGDGVLEVRDGEEIVARYLDGVGATAQWRSAQATTDYSPPALLGLDIKPQDRVVTIEYQTSEPARTEIRFGRTAGGPYDATQKDPSLSTQHSIQLQRLTLAARYYFVIALTDAVGNEKVADDRGQSFSFVAQHSDL